MALTACNRSRELISRRLDEPLTEFEHTLLDRHLSGCPDCRRFAGAAAGSTALLRAADLEPIPAPVALDLPHRFRTRVQVGAGTLVAAAAAMGVLAVTGNGFGGAKHGPNVTLPTASADLASMRVARAQQLRPPAVGLGGLRVRVLEVD
jgi:predicted anti-sigma-YlaC factor YlaD